VGDGADAAVRETDRQQLARYHQPIGKVTVTEGLGERLVRLQEI
jgi:hypothetical protein